MKKNKKIKKYAIIVFILSLLLIKTENICLAQKTLANPLGTVSIPELIGRVITAILGIIGSLSLLIFIYGGLTWMTSGGNEEKVKKGKQIIVWAVFGIVIIFTSYSILNLVFEILGT